MATVLQVQTGLVGYLGKEILPHVVPKTLKLGPFSIPIADTNFDFLADLILDEGVLEIMKWLGISTDGPELDVEAMAEKAKEKMTKYGGSVKIAGIGFAPADVDTMLEYIKRGTQ